MNMQNYPYNFLHTLTKKCSDIDDLERMVYQNDLVKEHPYEFPLDFVIRALLTYNKEHFVIEVSESLRVQNDFQSGLRGMIRRYLEEVLGDYIEDLMTVDGKSTYVSCVPFIEELELAEVE